MEHRAPKSKAMEEAGRLEVREEETLQQLGASMPMPLTNAKLPKTPGTSLPVTYIHQEQCPGGGATGLT